MSAEHPNVELLRRAYATFEAGDVDAFMAILADDIVWTIPGRNKLSGTYRGKAEVGALMAKLGELTGGETAIEVHDLLASDDHGVAVVRISSTIDGSTFSQNYVHLTHIVDGKATAFWELPEDQYAEDAFYGENGT